MKSPGVAAGIKVERKAENRGPQFYNSRRMGEVAGWPCSGDDRLRDRLWSQWWVWILGRDQGYMHTSRHCWHWGDRKRLESARGRVWIEEGRAKNQELTTWQPGRWWHSSREDKAGAAYHVAGEPGEGSQGAVLWEWERGRWSRMLLKTRGRWRLGADQWDGQ